MKRILIIEDEEPVRSNIAELLELEGYSVLEAENGRIGLRVAQTEFPDLVISDKNMPELDGYGVLAALRENPKTVDMPFIFLTASAEKVDMRKGMRLGADDYLTKPFTINELLSAVASRLERHEAIKKTLNNKLQELRANISIALPHELRTPLIAILGFSKLIKSDFETIEPADLCEMADYIHSSAEQLHRLIENYLFYVQLEIILTDTSKTHLLRKEITPNILDIISSVIFTKASTVYRTSDVICEIDDIPLAIVPEHFSKIIVEIADNAIKFSPPETPLKIESSVSGNQYTLQISNGGRGITDEQIANFGAYMQFDRLVQEQKGSGMGLAIVQRIISIYDGAFKIESIPNERTVLSITLPIAAIEQD